MVSYKLLVKKVCNISLHAYDPRAKFYTLIRLKITGSHYVCSPRDFQRAFARRWSRIRELKLVIYTLIVYSKKRQVIKLYRMLSGPYVRLTSGWLSKLCWIFGAVDIAEEVNAQNVKANRRHGQHKYYACDTHSKT